MQEMTPAQFGVVAELLRSRGSARTAAELVLVAGQSTSTAANATGTSPQGVSNALRRYRKAHTKLLHAYARHALINQKESS